MKKFKREQQAHGWEEEKNKRRKKEYKVKM